jgi:hypothetical protein
MTRRTLTNACGIMRRHGFVEHWAEWRKGVVWSGHHIFYFKHITYFTQRVASLWHHVNM